jgi:hypothetical protein
LYCCVVGFREELFNDLVLGVDLERGFQLGKVFLAHSLHHLAHAGRGFVFVGDDNGGAVGEARRDTNLFDGVSQRGLELFEERLQRLGLLRLGFALQVVAGCPFVDGLEVGFTVLVDGGEDDFVDVVVEDEDFDALLLVDLKQGRVPEESFGATGE